MTLAIFFTSMVFLIVGFILFDKINKHQYRITEVIGRKVERPSVSFGLLPMQRSSLAVFNEPFEFCHGHLETRNGCVMNPVS